jgi:hypothetical protein
MTRSPHRSSAGSRKLVVAASRQQDKPADDEHEGHCEARGRSRLPRAKRSQPMFAEWIGAFTEYCGSSVVVFNVIVLPGKH